MTESSGQPVDMLLANLDFLKDYLVEIAEQFRAEGRSADAEVAEGWSTLPDEAAETISSLLNLRKI